MTPTTREWLAKAEADRRIARRSLVDRPPEFDDGCFHCQQAVEKYLKGLLHERGIAFPKTHVISRLIELLLPGEPHYRALRTAAQRLTKYAVEYRYPGDRGNRRRLTAALKTVERVRAAVRRSLDLRP